MIIDSDGDGFPDAIDDDMNDDGIPDHLQDHDCDGIPDILDPDDDDDGYFDNKQVGVLYLIDQNYETVNLRAGLRSRFSHIINNTFVAKPHA